MVLTLANGVMRPLLALPLAWLIFVGAVYLALAISRQHKGLVWQAVIGWGLVFPVFLLLQGLLGIFASGEGWLPILPATVVTAALLTWATRSPLPAVGCATGWLLTVFVVGEPNWRTDLVEFIAVPWNLPVAASLLIWAWRTRRMLVPAGHCEKCGYDLRGLKEGVCPECGNVGVPKQ